MKKLAVLIDGGHLRALARKAGQTYDPPLIEKVGLQCSIPGEEIFRVLYHDCAPYMRSAKLPVSGTQHTFAGSDQWLHELACKDLFAVRRGILKFRGWKPRHVPISGILTDADFQPVFEQKGVDMRIGLDLALFAQARTVDRIALITNDTDCVAAHKHARRAGLQIVMISFPQSNISQELLAHADFKRDVGWP